MYLILLPIVGVYRKTCLKRPLKDIHNNGRLDKRALNEGGMYWRMLLSGSILQYFWPAICNNWSWKQVQQQFFVFFLSGLLRQVLLYTINFNGYPILEVKKKSDRPTHTSKTGSGKGKQNYL